MPYFFYLKWPVFRCPYLAGFGCPLTPETGNIVEYNVPTSPQKTLGGIASISDGNVWFTETAGLINNIGKISPATGIITEYNVPTSGQLNGITAGTDGNLWFVDGGPGKVDSISSTTGVINEYPVP